MNENYEKRRGWDESSREEKRRTDLEELDSRELRDLCALHNLSVTIELSDFNDRFHLVNLTPKRWNSKGKRKKKDSQGIFVSEKSALLYSINLIINLAACATFPSDS